ncbi:hypothetical protein [Streptomyces sp. B15]|uniref:hypothetical protein n=1 Tax=Streptomyces sp. B15 TaxID=1537797 RepID=UPI001B36EF1B|nr:hypothetical protein [Streptomyces sp. B15]MBQ1122260.1 hypothetical protein [Streptomyces sp. B15]
MALAYLLCVAISLGILAAALRPCRAPAPQPAPPAAAPAALPSAAEADVRIILAAAAQLAARLTRAA